MSRTTHDRPFKRREREKTVLLPERYQDLAAIAVILIGLLIFFAPVVLGGKTFLGPDTIASHSFDTFVQDARSQGIFPLWNPYIFCGYPAYGSLTVTGDRWFDLSWFALNRVQNFFGHLTANFSVGVIVFYYFILGIGAYVLARRKTGSRFASLLASLATVFSTFIIIWVMVGHNTKVVAVAWYPWIFLALEELQKEFRWWLVLGLALLFHFVFGSTHVQMIYYTGMSVGIWILVELIVAFARRLDWKPIVRTGLAAGIAALAAFAMDADRYLSVIEYTPHSIRGAGPLIPAPGSESTPASAGGLDYEYATNWSLSPGELMTFVVPTWYGFGHLTYDGRLTTQPMRFNGYWGPQPFTDAAQYMGAAVLFLAVIGFLRYRREPFVMFLGVQIVVSILIAFGKELSFFFDLMFAYAPGFNKFRVPSMILTLVQLSVPLLAAYGVRAIDEVSDNAAPATLRRWTRGAIGLAIALASVFVLRGVWEDIYRSFFPLQEVGPTLARQFGQVDGRVVSEFYEFVVDTVISDIAVVLIVSLVLVGGAVLLWRRSISWPAYAFALLAAVMFDLGRISYRPMNPEPRQEHTSIFAAPDYVQFLQKDSTLFRTLMIQNGQLPYDNTLAYWRIQSAYGYQGAKMRSYQDMAEVGGLYNPLVWQLMNVKYVISNTYDSTALFERVFDGSTFDVFRFRGELPRVFFVDRLEVASAEQTLNQIANGAFDPREVMYVLADPGVRIDPPAAGASVEVTEFGIQHLKLKATATGNNLLFLSETYYQPGWRAFIDGKEEGIIRANYLFRGLVVPPGEHTIEMRFESTGFEVGRSLSLGMNLLVIAGLGAMGFSSWRRRKQQPPQ